MVTLQGRIQDFKLGGAHLKKLRRAEGGSKMFGVFRVKNHDFTPKILIFPILGGARAGCAPTGSAPALVTIQYKYFIVNQDAIVSCTIKVHL
jgi:hypothetical protein